jgi:PAS domain S-box-containing protein
VSSERPPAVLVFGAAACPTAASLADRPDVAGRVETGPTTSLEETDCIVTCEPSLPTAIAVEATSVGIPVVACDCSDDPEATADLADRIDAAVDDPSPIESRLARLHTGAAELVGLTDREQLFDHVVDSAKTTLAFDVVAIFAACEDGFRRVGAAPETAVPDRLPPDHGLTAWSHETGNSIRVDDIDAHAVADSPTNRFRSGIGIPFGTKFVFEGLSDDLAAFDETDLELAELLCDHAAQAIARLDAESDLQRREATVTALHRAAPRLIDAGDEATLFERTVAIAEEVLSFDRSYLMLADGDAGFVRVAGNDDDISSPGNDTGILGKTYETGESYLVRDAAADPDARPAHETTRSAISVPFGDAGVFQALSTRDDAFDETDLELAELLLSYASATRDRIRSEAALRSSRQTVERLHAAAADIAAAETEADLLDHAIHAVEEVLAFEKSTILLREGDLLVPVVASEERHPDGARSMHVSEGFGGKTLRSGESALVGRMASDPDADPVREDYRSGISVPIGDHGVFQAAASEEYAFDEDDLELAELLMSHVAVSLERVRVDAERRGEHNRLRALFENIPSAAIEYEMVGGEPYVREVNEAFERTFGYPAEVVIDASLDAHIVPQDDEHDATAFNDRLERGERIQAEVERLTADGPRHFLLQVIPLEVGAENSQGYAIYSDVTERMRREEELRRQNERLDEFASVVSHDLRNPLNVAQGYLDLARESGDDAQFERVERAHDRMDTLVTDLLVLAREGRDVGETESVAVASAAERAWANVATGTATLDVRCACEIEGDPDRLVELFENLFRNSVEHGSTSSRPGADDAVEHATPDDAPSAPCLTVTVGDRGGRSGFFVADDGVGIDADFDPFETGKTTSEDGTGFGLSIVKSVAEAHGWSVAVGESESGGARFDVVV